MDIIVDGITKKYGRQNAVEKLSFQVKTGEILGFLDPNSAGKTTTMKAITGYLETNEGDIEVGGISVNQNPDAWFNSITSAEKIYIPALSLMN